MYQRLILQGKFTSIQPVNSRLNFTPEDSSRPYWDPKRQELCLRWSHNLSYLLQSARRWLYFTVHTKRPASSFPSPQQLFKNIRKRQEIWTLVIRQLPSLVKTLLLHRPLSVRQRTPSYSNSYLPSLAKALLYFLILLSLTICLF